MLNLFFGRGLTAYHKGPGREVRAAWAGLPWNHHQGPGEGWKGGIREERSLEVGFSRQMGCPGDTRNATPTLGPTLRSLTLYLSSASCLNNKDDCWGLFQRVMKITPLSEPSPKPYSLAELFSPSFL